MNKLAFRFSIIILQLIFNHSTVFAQKKDTILRREYVERRIENMKKTLQLSQAQANSVSTINNSFFDGMAAIEKSEDDVNIKGAKRKVLFEEKERQLKKILTKEQYVKLQGQYALRRKEAEVRVKSLEAKRKNIRQ